MWFNNFFKRNNSKVSHEERNDPAHCVMFGWYWHSNSGDQDSKSDQCIFTILWISPFGDGTDDVPDDLTDDLTDDETDDALDFSLDETDDLMWQPLVLVLHF